MNHTSALVGSGAEYFQPFVLSSQQSTDALLYAYI